MLSNEEFKRKILDSLSESDLSLEHSVSEKRRNELLSQFNKNFFSKEILQEIFQNQRKLNNDRI